MMDIYAFTDKAILKQIGTKIKEERVAKNISQSALAEACGLSQFSISQVENGHNTSLGSLIMILRALNRLEVLDGLFAEKPISPIALSQMQKKEGVKKHAYKRNNANVNENENADFNWDEE